ncbi:MAG: flagellar basal body P-ring formation protein FlgA [Desulfobulbus sp.]|nr:flagellar basal body P-ring formation protein FlgA [Desulfobulbus sp.]
MRSTVQLILPAIFCLFWPGLGQAATITVDFHKTAVVTAARVVLADIADISPDSDQSDRIGRLVVGVAPPPGKTREIQATAVITGLRNRPETADVQWQGSPTTVVERKTQILRQNQFFDIITAYIDENSSHLPKNAEEIRFIPIHAPAEVMVPPGKLSWKVVPSRPGIIGSNSFAIHLLVDGKPAGTQVVRGRLEIKAEVAVTVTGVQRGDLLSAANVTMQQQDITGIDTPFTEISEVIGKQMARTLPAGTVLKADHLVLPPVVKDGEMVKILARKKTMLVSAHGLARANGRIGEMIAVKNISSNKTIHARVEGPGTVTVEF